MTSGTEAVERRLVELGDRLQAINAARAEVMELVRRAVREADRAGVPRNTIAKLLGVSRQTVYNTLGQGV